MGTVYLVVYRQGRDSAYQVKGAFSTDEGARDWAERSFGKFTADWHVEPMSVDSPRSAW